MSTQSDSATGEMVRTTVMVPKALDQAIRDLAEAHDRPLSREVRRALEAHVEREKAEAAA